MTRSQKIFPAVVAAIVSLAALVLYWPSMRLPVIYDSLLHIRIAKGLDMLSVWLPTGKFGFYRPLTFFPLLVIRAIFGAYPAWLLHGLNVFQHALNAILVALLSWRLWQDGTRSLATGLLFALFPFSYQAIAVYGHNVHPSTANLMLLGLHAYLNAVQNGKKRWWAATGILFFSSLISHETAILFGPLAALVHWNFRPELLRKSKARLKTILSRSTPWLAFTLLGGAYAILYQLLPISRTPQALEQGNNLVTKGLYLTQAAVHPFAWLAHILTDLSAVTIVTIGLVLTLALTIWRAREKAGRLALLLGWGWWGMASLVIAIPLPTSYLLHGPRLLYLGSIGVAILWATLLQPQRPQVMGESFGKEHFGGRLIQAAVLVFILITGWRFVRSELALYTQLATPILNVRVEMTGRPPEEGVLLVNLPGWLAPQRNTYAVGSEHAAMMGHHLFIDELVNVNLQADRPTRVIKLPELLNDPGYPYGIFGNSDLSQPIQAGWAPAGSHVFITTLKINGVESTYTGCLAPSGSKGTPVATFGQYILHASEIEQCGGMVQSITQWSLTGDQPAPASVSLFMQLLDGQGQLVSQADGPPLGLRSDLIHMNDDWNITDRRLFSVNEEQNLQLVLGAYDYITGERLAANDAEQNPLPDNALRLPVGNCTSGEN
ncbi:MAG: hypothetical protein JXA42_19260 [Anaerolineales bacterium]|nr:hypothetical protein [Anaerolineales bacterium]